MSVYQSDYDKLIIENAEILAENSALRARAERLEKALRKYGQHASWCENSAPEQSLITCSCGLDAALAEQEPPK